ncbi:sugar phosphate isomerase [Christiangramia fulva]|uniref:Sugar phosphate isomerase n=2 Tax=Christiangramia fulva TaxID=2126553 RepID=A0A2R3Z1R1_9FLAO|nr:sugar phosphate isomerase [Christiangramia fulva]
MTNFKKWGLLALLGVFLSVTNSFAQERFGGLALYTVRDAMADNPKETLKKVADMGYKYIEAAGYENGKFYGMEPKEFKKYLDELGLIPLSTHQGSVTLENADKMMQDVKDAGFEYFVLPVPPMGYFTYDQEKQSMGMKDDVKTLTNIFNTLGKKAEAKGLKLLYHNHNFEFKENENGIKAYDYFLKNTDPKYVNFQMDLYWITKAGEDPVAYFKKYPGRFKLWHVKDMDDQGRFAPVGTGTIDFKRIFNNKDLAGMQHYLVEQDKTFNHTPLEAAKISHENLKAI